MNLRNSYIPVLKMMISMAIFGSIGFFSTKTNLPSFDLVFVRCICATIFLGLYWLFSGRWKEEQWNKQEVIQIIFCGVFLVFNWVFLFKAFGNMSVTIAISIYHLAPIIVLLFGSILFRERLTWISIISILMCFIGTVIVAGITKEVSLHSILSSGMIWGLLAALFYAFTTLLGKGISKMSAYAMTFIQTGVGIFLLLPFVHFNSFLGLTTTNWIFIIATGVIHTGFVYYLFFDSLRYLSTTMISILVFLDPGVAIILDVVFTGFIPTIVQTVGIVLIFFGMSLSLIKSKEKSIELDI